MSERIVDNPANHGWVEEDGKWVWDGQSAGSIEDGDTEGQVTTWSGTAWTPESAVVVSGGNVGIGTSRDFTSGLDVSTSGSSLSPSGAKITGRFSVGDAKSTSVMLGANTDGTPHGVVAGANELGFYTYDGGWHERLRIDATGKATFSQGAFGKYFAFAGSHYIEKVGDNMTFVASSGGTMTFATGDTGPKLTLDSSGNATFSGTAGFNTVNNPLNLFSDETHYTIGVVSSGRTEYKSFNRHEFSCHNDATALAVSGYVEVTGAVYAADHVASSDERLKDNITTAPVGLIDSLKGREWDWSESGEKGSGVVAQELEQVLPHLVHEDDEGMKSVSYNGLVAYLIEEVKALRAEVEELKS